MRWKIVFGGEGRRRDQRVIETPQATEIASDVRMRTLLNQWPCDNEMKQKTVACLSLYFYVQDQSKSKYVKMCVCMTCVWVEHQ